MKQQKKDMKRTNIDFERKHMLWRL